MSRYPPHYANGPPMHDIGYHTSRSSSRHREYDNGSDSGKMAPRILDVYGGQRDITVCGHIDVVHLLPLRQNVHKQLIETYRRIPGNYEGKFDNREEKAKVINYGNGYVAMHLYDDLTRPELGEFLLSKGWRMLGFSSAIEGGTPNMCEKWTNVHIRGEK